MRLRTKLAIDDTIAAIAKHSTGVTWHHDSAGLALILTTGGYALTARPETHQTEALLEARKFTLNLLKPGASCKDIWDAYNGFLRKHGKAEEERLQ